MCDTDYVWFIFAVVVPFFNLLLFTFVYFLYSSGNKKQCHSLIVADYSGNLGF